MDDNFRVSRRAVYEQLVEHLEKLIRTGEFARGSALPSERDLAGRFEVSRNSVRQAIAYLEAKGLVQTRHGSGVFIPEEPLEGTAGSLTSVTFEHEPSLKEVVEVRLGLDPLMAELAAQRRSEEDLADLELFLKPQEPPDSLVAPGNFHVRLARAAGNPVLQQLQRALITGPQNIDQLTDFDPSCGNRWDQAHQEIHAAVRDSDPVQARELMTTHVNDVLNIAELFSREHES